MPSFQEIGILLYYYYDEMKFDETWKLYYKMIIVLSKLYDVTSDLF